MNWETIKISSKSRGKSRRDAAIIGDRMDTDIIAGIENEMDTVLVLSGVSTVETVGDYAYRPKFILSDVGEIAAD